MKSIIVGPSDRDRVVTQQALINIKSQMEKPSEDRTQVCNVLRLSKVVIRIADAEFIKAHNRIDKCQRHVRPEDIRRCFWLRSLFSNILLPCAALS